MRATYVSNFVIQSRGEVKVTSASVRAILGDFYQYRKLKSDFSYEELEKYQKSLRKRYKVIAEVWDKNLNTEWLLRHYLSVKMILSASVMLTSLEYSKEKNVRIVEPYLLYYSLLTSCRALLFTIPEVKWNNGEIIKATHNKIINVTSDQLGLLNSAQGRVVKDKLKNFQDYRELFSYRFPASGMHLITDKETIDLDEAIELSTIIVEMAQFNSEQLQYCLHKYYEEQKFEVDPNFLMQVVNYNFGEAQLIDGEDRYRLGYFLRKQHFPLNLYWTMREGLVEDFFGSWCAEEEDTSDLYNPDKNWRIIYSVP